MKLILATALLCLHFANAEDTLRSDLREFVTEKLMGHSTTVNCGKESSCGTTCTAKKDGYCAKNKKCKTDRNKETCNPECGCLSCPCCQYDEQEDAGVGKYCPPADAEQCLAMQDRAFEVGDPIGCFADFVAKGELINTNEKCKDISSKEECNTVLIHGGNECQWFNYQNHGKNGGECVTNPCSNINDGSCTLQQTGGRCVWYGNNKNLKMLKDEDGKDAHYELPNPFGDFAGCYSTPCTSASYSYTNTEDETVSVTNKLKSCTAMNSIGYLVPGQLDENGLPKEEGSGLTAGSTPKSKSPYQCEWCNLGHKGTTGKGKMGCQNSYQKSYARCARIAGQEKQGKCPCLNDFCNFYKSPFKRTNAAPEATQFGDGKNAVVCEYRPDGENGEVQPKLVPRTRTLPPTAQNGQSTDPLDTAGKSKALLQRELNAALAKISEALVMLNNNGVGDLFKIPRILMIMEGPAVGPRVKPPTESRNAIRKERNAAVTKVENAKNLLAGDEYPENEKLGLVLEILTSTAAPSATPSA